MPADVHGDEVGAPELPRRTPDDRPHQPEETL